MHTADIPAIRDSISSLTRSVSGVIRGQARALRPLLAAFLSGGHVLLDDVPGTGKTTLAKTLAKAFAARFTRIQFTPDLLPSDILGVAIYDQRSTEFVFHEGPVFTNILLADEINRSSPRTQSALLEAMAEGQVSVEGQRRILEDPFLVIATQNPVEFRGTYPLPEAQMDRFAVQLRLGYVSTEDEVAMLADQMTGHPLDQVTPVLTIDQMRQIRAVAQGVLVSEEVRRYIVALVTASRTMQGVRLGASPRASLALMKTAQALALIDGLAFTTPKQVQELAIPVLAHRLLLEPGAQFSGRTGPALIEDLLTLVPVPI